MIADCLVLPCEDSLGLLKTAASYPDSFWEALLYPLWISTAPGKEPPTAVRIRSVEEWGAGPEYCPWLISFC